MTKATKKMIESSAEMDMTPMIDIVFNLLIFFMIVTDLSQKDLANLTLPLAYMAQQDKADDPDDRLILNINDKGELMFKGKARTLAELGTILDHAKKVYNLKMKAKGKTGVDKFGEMEASKLYVLLRADRDTPWQHVQWIMTIMAEQKLYKLQFATKKYVDATYRDRKWGDKAEWQVLDGRFQEEDKEEGG